MKVYETLSGSDSDKFQYIFPYYDFNKSIESDFNGSFNFLLVDQILFKIQIT